MLHLMALVLVLLFGTMTPCRCTGVKRSAYEGELSYDNAFRYCKSKGSTLADQSSLEHLFTKSQFTWTNLAFWIPLTRHLLLHWRSIDAINIIPSEYNKPELVLAASECSHYTIQEPIIDVMCSTKPVTFLCVKHEYTCPVGNSCIYTDSSLLVTLDHNITLLEAHKFCTTDGKTDDTLGIITNGKNKQILKDIEDKLSSKGKYQFGRIYNLWLTDPYHSADSKQTETLLGWENGEPSTNVSESCVVMSGGSLKIKPVPCSSKNSYVCKGQDVAPIFNSPQPETVTHIPNAETQNKRVEVMMSSSSQGLVIIVLSMVIICLGLGLIMMLAVTLLLNWKSRRKDKERTSKQTEKDMSTRLMKDQSLGVEIL